MQDYANEMCYSIIVEFDFFIKGIKVQICKFILFYFLKSKKVQLKHVFKNIQYYNVQEADQGWAGLMDALMRSVGVATDLLPQSEPALLLSPSGSPRLPH